MDHLTHLPLEVLRIIFITLGILNNDDWVEIYAVNRRLRNIIRSNVRRRVITIDTSTEIDAFVDKWQNDDRRELADSVHYEGWSRNSRAHIPLRLQIDMHIALGFFNNITHIEISYVNPWYFLTCLINERHLPLQIIEVDWMTSSNDNGSRTCFFKANFAHRDTITNILLPSGDYRYITYAENHLEDNITLPWEEYLELFPLLNTVEYYDDD